MKVIIAGGSGFLGKALANFYSSNGAQVVVLTRGQSTRSTNAEYVHWNGRDVGSWAEVLEGADLLVNLAGRSVNCRYTKANRAEILSSRLDSVRVLSQAITQLAQPVKVWIQSSSATIYRHAEDKDMDETDGEIGTGFSVEVCKAWENAFNSADLPGTRKVLVRTGIVLGRHGGAFTELVNLCRIGLGGTMGPGTQYISWVHVNDFTNMVEWLRANGEASGVYNCVAPVPVINRLFMFKVKKSVKRPFQLSSPVWLLVIGAFLRRTETELILKSRRVVPLRFLREGYRFIFPNLHSAIADLTGSQD